MDRHLQTSIMDLVERRLTIDEFAVQIPKFGVNVDKRDTVSRVVTLQNGIHKVHLRGHGAWRRMTAEETLDILKRLRLL